MLDANALADKRIEKLDGTMDEAQWLYRGRLLQVLGLLDEAKAAYANVREDREMLNLVKRYLKE